MDSNDYETKLHLVEIKTQNLSKAPLTYRELVGRLRFLSDAELDQPAVIFDHEEGDCLSVFNTGRLVSNLSLLDDDSEIKQGHPVLIF